MRYETSDAYRNTAIASSKRGGGRATALACAPNVFMREPFKKQDDVCRAGQHPKRDRSSECGTPSLRMASPGRDDPWNRRLVWPLSMPNYGLSKDVKRARHALALDDERDTFHPLLWDEQHEYRLIQQGTVKADRLQQVWFAGMHSDVGGGYPDDALAHVPLEWMIAEAKATGLRFNDDAMAIIERTMNESGPIHDSRRGLAGYYRYQPRKMSARVEPRDPSTLIMQDPDLDHGLLRSVHVHASVLNRIRRGADCYAPIVLPRDYEVVGPVQGAPETAAEAATRATQEYVWNQVWRKRLTFANVAASLILAAMPLIQRPPPRPPVRAAVPAVPILLSRGRAQARSDLLTLRAQRWDLLSLIVAGLRLL